MPDETERGRCERHIEEMMAVHRETSYGTPDRLQRARDGLESLQDDIRRLLGALERKDRLLTVLGAQPAAPTQAPVEEVILEPMVARGARYLKDAAPDRYFVVEVANRLMPVPGLTIGREDVEAMIAGGLRVRIIFASADRTVR